jgi:opacity protein-like surface antigen
VVSDEAIYLSGSVGIVFPHELELGLEADPTRRSAQDLDQGLMGTIAIGMRIRGDADSSYRAEVEFGVRYNDLGDYETTSAIFGTATIDSRGQMISGTFMLNLFWDITTEKWIQPYIGAGVGVAVHTLTITDAIPGTGDVRFEEDAAAFAFQALIGVSVPVTDHFFITLGYRFFGSSDFDVIGETVDSFYAHTIEAGIRVELP